MAKLQIASRILGRRQKKLRNTRCQHKQAISNTQTSQHKRTKKKMYRKNKYEKSHLNSKILPTVAVFLRLNIIEVYGSCVPKGWHCISYGLGTPGCLEDQKGRHWGNTGTGDCDLVNIFPETKTLQWFHHFYLQQIMLYIYVNVALFCHKSYVHLRRRYYNPMNSIILIILPSCSFGWFSFVCTLCFLQMGLFFLPWHCQKQVCRNRFTVGTLAPRPEQRNCRVLMLILTWQMLELLQCFAELSNPYQLKQTKNSSQ